MPKDYPCDGPENICPFNAIYTDDCRRHCGLGVDEDNSVYKKKYDDCYDGCGGEDCLCCEIFQSHQYELTAPPCTGDDEYDIYGNSHIPYEPIDDDDEEDE